jgi:TonB family protein
MRRSIAAALVALSVGVAALPPSPSFAQEQPEGKRKIAYKAIPIYPDLARKMQMRGTVRVQVVVASNGRVKLTQVIGGNPLLAKAAVDAIEKWKWTEASTETKELIELSFHPE